MADIASILKDRFSQAISSVFGAAHTRTDPLIRPSANPKFGDYQANVAMSLGKQLGRKPRHVADAIRSGLEIDDLCETVAIAGPGFINLTLKTDVLARLVEAFGVDERLGVGCAERPATVVVDYSSPNVAKEMHVGHLRSTVIGDCICRVLDFAGHRVIRQNHLGDWGTQFGMLIEGLVLNQSEEEAAKTVHSFADLEAFYRDAKAQFDADPAFAARSRQRVVKLQSGDEITKQLWDRLVRASAVRFQCMYDRLGVQLTDEDVRGESFYNSALPHVVADLEGAGLVRESQGAKVVFPEGFIDRDRNPLPLIVRKSDGGFLYATTDLAAARYRIGELKADRIIYVTDARQSQHFQMIFATLRKAGWTGPDLQLDHVAFGTILGKDGKPFKTRSGDTVRLADLLDEAEQRAATTLEQKNPDLPAEARRAIARAIGIGALKYGDLCSDRIKDYVFDWDRMLALEGNTAPYLQNAYVRIRSIFRKGGIDPSACAGAALLIGQPAERAVALKLLQLPAVVVAVADTLEPHRLCTFLYELASLFHQFYEQCPVLAADDSATRDSRLLLCDLSARTLGQGLALLGIETVERM